MPILKADIDGLDIDLTVESFQFIPCYSRVAGGVNQGLMVCSFVWIWEKLDFVSRVNPERPDDIVSDWVIFTAKDWERLTTLSTGQQRRARKNLEKTGFWFEKEHDGYLCFSFNLTKLVEARRLHR